MELDSFLLNFGGFYDKLVLLGKILSPRSYNIRVVENFISCIIECTLLFRIQPLPYQLENSLSQLAKTSKPHHPVRITSSQLYAFKSLYKYSILFPLSIQRHLLSQHKPHHLLLSKIKWRPFLRVAYRSITLSSVLGKLF